MKKFVVFLMVLVMLSAVCSTTLAAGNVYFEGALKGTEKVEVTNPLGTTKNEYDLSDYTFGLLFPINRLILGGEYSFGTNEEETKHTMWNARVGYICFGSPKFYVFPVVSLLGISQKDDDPTKEMDVSATLVGVDAVWNITDKFNLYGSFGYALNASLESPIVLATKEEGIRTIVFKGNYAFTDHLALSVSYRNLNLAGKLELTPAFGGIPIDQTVNLETYTAGLSYKF